MKTTLCVYIGTQNGIKLVGETFAVCRISVKTTKLFSHVAFIVYGILCFIHPSATPFFVIYSYVYTYACYQIAMYIATVYVNSISWSAHDQCVQQ